MSRTTIPPVIFHSDDPAKDLAELAHIMLNLRHHSKMWGEHYGHAHKNRKNRWEVIADKWISDHIKKEKDYELPAPDENDQCKIIKKSDRT